MKPARPKRTRQRAAVKASRPSLSSEQLKDAQAALGYHFKETELLIRAFTHPSAVTNGDSIALTNQRLEFLGDRVLNLVIAQRLIERRRGESEGDLAPRLNRLVKKGACADAVRYKALQTFIILSDGEEVAGGRDRDSTLGDACEAIIGAIYMDGGLTPARKFIESAWAPQFNAPAEQIRDPKTLLQELAQGQGLPLPSYTVIGRSGPDHSPVFEIKVTVSGQGEAAATGPSKREAERAAAATLLKQITG